MEGFDIIFGIAILLVSVVIHEVSHGYAANALGDPTAKLQGRLTLNPIAHLDPVGSFLVPIGLLLLSGGSFWFGWAKPVPYNPYNVRHGKWGEALVAAAGPASNIALAVLFGLALRFGVVPEAALGIVFSIVLINVVLAVFNLVPIPPLDGSKILFALLPYRFQEVRFMLERYGLIVVLLFVTFLWRLIDPVVGFILRLILGS